MTTYVGAAGLAARYVGQVGPSRYIGVADRAAWDALAGVDVPTLADVEFWGEDPAEPGYTNLLVDAAYTVPDGHQLRVRKSPVPIDIEVDMPGADDTVLFVEPGVTWQGGVAENPGDTIYGRLYLIRTSDEAMITALELPSFIIAVQASDSGETAIEGTSGTITPDANGDSLTTSDLVVTGSGTATVNADGYQIDYDLDPNSDGGTLAIVYTVTDSASNTASATATIAIEDWDLEATLEPALVQIDDTQTIADAWADASMPTSANFSGLTGDVTVSVEGQIDGGAWSAANMTAALTEGQTYAARVIATDTYGNTATFTTQTHTVASSTATVPAAFTVGMWDVVDNPDADGNKADITVSSLPADNGSPLTEIRYTVDGGAQQMLTNSPAAGTWTVTLPQSETQQAVLLYAVNAEGTSAASDEKNVTPTYSFTFTEEAGVLTATGTEGEYTFEVTDTGSPYYANSPYTFNTSSFATGPIALDVPPISGSTADGSVLDGEPALFVADEDDGAYSAVFQWQRSPAGTDTWADISNQREQTYTVDTLADAGYDLRRVERATSADTGPTEAASNVIGVPAAGDETAPVLTNAYAVVNTATSASMYVTTDEQGGTLYRMATTDATQPTEAQMLDGSAPTAVMHASSGVPTVGEQTRTYNGFTAGETYYGWWMQVDGSGNVSNIIGTGSFTMQIADWDATFSTDGSATVAITSTPPIPAQPTGTFSSDGTTTVEITG